MTLLSEFDQIAVPVADQYLIYRIEAECYAIKVVNVSEIRSWEAVARVPNTPASVKGILNLRGSAVPVVDMRIRLGVSAPEYGKQTVVIVVSSNIEGRDRLAALVVDSVWEVMIATVDDIRATPDFGNAVETEFIVGCLLYTSDAADE